MNRWRKLTLLLKEIGLPNMGAFALYQLQHRSGALRRATPRGVEIPINGIGRTDLFAQHWDSWKQLGEFTPNTVIPDNLLNGYYSPFGGALQPLDLTTPVVPLEHWTRYSSEVNGVDIKLLWEPARFLWSLDLARSYELTKDEKYAECFWCRVEEFIAANPVNSGPNWASAQELAIRVSAWIISLGAMRNCQASTPERLNNITRSIYQHADRIPLTLNYAKSQNNNHVLSESLGLILSGDFLRSVSPKADNWISLGELEFEQAILNQIDDQGNYSQHSANYHRMMLQLALLYEIRNRRIGRPTPASVSQKLELATRWLAAQLDPVSGRLPNLGHNDGSLLLPFGTEEYRDYRPTAQAASRAFIGTPCLPPGKWDELSTWLGLDQSANYDGKIEITSSAVHKIGSGAAWGTLRGVKFNGRPAHCDQLHVDLWWDGVNIARDAGTFSYNALPPWQNALDCTRVHNTIMIDHKDQMERVSRFLWLDQAQAKWLPGAGINTLKASHDGYAKLGVIHQRSMEYLPGSGFVVRDELLTKHPGSAEHTAIIHWLLPDWEWTLVEGQLILSCDQNRIAVLIKAVQKNHEMIEAAEISLIRGGKRLAGSREDQVLGWESDTYNEKHPALSFSCAYSFSQSITISTTWKLTNERD